MKRTLIQTDYEKRFRASVPKDNVDGLTKRPFYFFTLAYGLYYICGGVAGYVKMKSVLCICVSIPLGVLLMLLGLGHIIDCKRRVPIEPYYLGLPAVISFVVAVVFTCFHSIGGKFVPSGLVAMNGWISFCLYVLFLTAEYGKDLFNGKVNMQYLIVVSTSDRKDKINSYRRLRSKLGNM